jgi:xanthine dehydrogenase accessory factor
VHKELELWQFIADRLRRDQSVMALVVAESSGSSPGRQGYKMAVGADGKLCGSIGGGVMEVNLVEQARADLRVHSFSEAGLRSHLVQQEHRKNSQHPSGMICSGRQTLIVTRLEPEDMPAVAVIIDELRSGRKPWLTLTEEWFRAASEDSEPQNSPLPFFECAEDLFTYTDKLGRANELFIVGGGHCALALSELMTRLDFRVSVLDDRPELNTVAENRFADEVIIIDRYDNIASYIPWDEEIYIVVMTLGYLTDEIVIRALVNREFKYFGVLGSKAKMATLINDLKKDGIAVEKIARIHTPIGLPINSHSPEEIAVSIAAEIIAIKNTD